MAGYFVRKEETGNNEINEQPEHNNEEEKYGNDGIISIIDQDYLLNFLSDMDTNQRRAMPGSNFFNSVPQEIQIPFQAYHDAQKAGGEVPGIFPKLPHQDQWLLGMNGMNDSKMLYPTIANFKFDNYEDYENSGKNKKLKTGKEMGLKRNTSVNSNISGSDPNSKANQKSNIKNTYINKINSLITEKPEKKVEDEKSFEPMIKDAKKVIVKNESDNQLNKSGGMKKVKSYDVLKPDEFEKMNVKLARNRESARNSRKRKKIYIELLEKKVDQLTNELNQTRKQLELNSNNLNKITFQSKLMNNLVTGKQQLFERLEKMLNSGTDEQEIGLLIDSLRLRLGATGKERINAINFFFKQIIELLIPVHMKYLLWAACEGKDLFSASKEQPAPQPTPENPNAPESITDYWSELASQVNITDGQRKSMIKYRKKLVNEKQKFEGLITQLNNIRKAILKQSNSIQNVIDDFRGMLSPVQTGKILIILDKERNRKEFTNEKLWQSLKTKKENREGAESDGSEFDDDEDDDFDTGNEMKGSGGLSNLLPTMDSMESLKGTGNL